MADHEPVLMLGDDENGYGTRWTICGQQVEPAIARFLMSQCYICESGVTDFGARRLDLTDSGQEFRQEGLKWWASLNILQKIKAAVFG